ncbi:hypothetical protein PR202_gb26612 [Eleusine coracana subsp. coracana]|uniref:Uncharacterized protein n=1 Tax=Eleusine coracana subsp. coracana TaxID=191504 RepID=A0AAV5FRP2_ELECO|nr:hypothetical protein PR202_gb26612 [Eleusine coracana subsp. coracana]
MSRSADPKAAKRIVEYLQKTTRRRSGLRGVPPRRRLRVQLRRRRAAGGRGHGGSSPADRRDTRAERGGWEAPAECAAWEEEQWYVASANADVCYVYLIGALQALLLSERPGVGGGLVAALALAVPASAFVLVSHLLLEASRGILSNLPH